MRHTRRRLLQTTGVALGGVGLAGCGGRSGTGADESTATETDPELSGGPNVVSGVPEDADHVVSMQAVAFEPAGMEGTIIVEE